MAYTSGTLRILRNAGLTLPLTFTDSAGDPVDLTDSIVTFIVKENLIDSDLDKIIEVAQATHTAPLLGQTAIQLTSEQTNIKPRSYKYGIKLQYTGLDPVYTFTGDFVILPNIEKGGC